MKNKLNQIILGLIIIPTFCFSLAIDIKASAIEQADSAYLNGNYEVAESLYTEIIQTQGISAGLLYNLGNVYYKEGKDGEAMLCYERAKKLEPSDPLIRQNLNFLQSKVADANRGELGGKQGNVDADPESFVDTIYRMIAIDTKSNSWAVLAVMAFILFLGGTALYIFTPVVLARKTGFFSAIVFLGFTIAFVVFALIAASQYNRQDEAVLISFTTELVQSPENNSKPVTTPLHKGTKLRILEERKGKDGVDWLKVKLNSENVGWLKKNEIEII